VVPVVKAVALWLSMTWGSRYAEKALKPNLGNEPGRCWGAAVRGIAQWRWCCRSVKSCRALGLHWCL